MRKLQLGALRPLLLAIVFGQAAGPVVAASPPAVRFSAGQTVACRDVTPPEFAALYPTEKLIEAQFRISVLLWQGSEEQIEELLVVFSSPQRRLRVVDFWPKTESVTDIAGPIERSETNDSTRSLEAGIKGALSGGQAGLSGQITPSLSAGQTRHTAIKESYRKLPPKQLLLASGPLDGDASVFFKLKPSTQESLQGARLFSCVFAVPADWRGDWAHVTCLAKGQNTRQLVPRIEECGRASFYLGLHLEGDLDAKLLAEQLDQAQARAEAPADAADLSARSLAASRHWPSGMWRAIGLRRDEQPSAPRRHEALKPLPTLPQALDALQALSGQ
jgi:hypothetical protein